MATIQMNRGGMAVKNKSIVLASYAANWLRQELREERVISSFERVVPVIRTSREHLPNRPAAGAITIALTIPRVSQDTWVSRIF